METEKKKREPSKWNLFLKGCMPEQDKDLTMPEKVSICGVEYRTLKDEDPNKLNEIIDLIKNQKDKKK